MDGDEELEGVYVLCVDKGVHEIVDEMVTVKERAGLNEEVEEPEVVGDVVEELLGHWELVNVTKLERENPGVKL
jgi:nucleotide-binding universal stress UspA family protein